METSLFLAKVVGIFLIVVGIYAIRNYKTHMEMFKAIMSNPALRYIFGTATLILGLLLVGAHNVWTEGWKALITIIGWVGIIKGASVLLLPEKIMLGWVEKFNTSNWYVMGGVLWIVAGVYLAYIGFFF